MAIMSSTPTGGSGASFAYVPSPGELAAGVRQRRDPPSGLVVDAMSVTGQDWSGTLRRG
jgi:hypothetical protein